MSSRVLPATFPVEWQEQSLTPRERLKVVCFCNVKKGALPFKALASCFSRANIVSVILYEFVLISIY